MGTKSCDDWLRPKFGTVNNCEYKLGEVETYPRVLPSIIEALEKKGMRFDEVSMDNGDIRYLNHDIVVFRGGAAKLLHCAFHGLPSRVTRKKIRQCNLSLSCRRLALRRFYLRLAEILHAPRKFLWIVHKCSLPSK